jgi:hypothetical protein
MWPKLEALQPGCEIVVKYSSIFLEFVDLGRPRAKLDEHHPHRQI